MCYVIFTIFSATYWHVCQFGRVAERTGLSMLETFMKLQTWPWQFSFPLAVGVGYQLPPWSDYWLLEFPWHPLAALQFVPARGGGEWGLTGMFHKFWNGSRTGDHCAWRWFFAIHNDSYPLSSVKCDISIYQIVVCDRCLILSDASMWLGDFVSDLQRASARQTHEASPASCHQRRKNKKRGAAGGVGLAAGFVLASRHNLCLHALPVCWMSPNFEVDYFWQQQEYFSSGVPPTCLQCVGLFCFSRWW